MKVPSRTSVKLPHMVGRSITALTLAAAPRAGCGGEAAFLRLDEIYERYAPSS